MSHTRRLIESWLPIAELGEESVRERRSMTALPPTYYLHVWWARRPLVASRAAVLASLLPADADRDKFMHVLGIHGDPVATRRRIDAARKTGENLGTDVYGYRRAFSYVPSEEEKKWLAHEARRNGVSSPTVLDPTAGGGSIPFEAARLGLATHANDLNPVAALILRQTVEAPARLGADVLERYQDLAGEFLRRAEPRFQGVYPAEPPGRRVDGYLWARTITCPYCDGLIPLSPNWRLSSDGTGVRLIADPDTKRCRFEVVQKAKDQSPGTVARGDALCPYPGCARVVDGDEVKRQAQAGQMGEQLFAIVYSQETRTTTRTGRATTKNVRGFRAATPEDDNSTWIAKRLAEKMEEWEATDVLPIERLPEGFSTSHPINYGQKAWRNLFSPRQLLGHGLGVEVFRELVEERRQAGRLDDVDKAAFGYLAIALDKMLNYNSRMSVWMSTRGVVANTFNRHDFAFCWSHAEMAPVIPGLGLEWALEQTRKSLRELIELVRPGAGSAASAAHASQAKLSFEEEQEPVPVTIHCTSADRLDALGDASVDAVVMDPPYYDNVMYAELSDFFYVWLKRTAGLVYPELFRRQLTDKESEAVANPARFRGETGAAALAARDYREKMQAVFAECRRVLNDDGILTLMFTHKATGAWDALARGLVEAGFTITASWPINTEAEWSLHIKNKAAARSTVFLVCRPRAARLEGHTAYWEEVEPLVRKAVRSRVQEFQDAGIRGVDLYLSCFGPALEEFASHWPLTRGTPLARPEKRARQLTLEDDFDPYAVNPEDALEAARREVKAWRMDQLLRAQRRAELDGVTEWFVLAWDAFRAPEFPYDEALRLARVAGVDLDQDVVGRLAEKKGSDLLLWDSAKRAQKGSLGAPDGSRGIIDALHNLAWRVRSQGLDAAKRLLESANLSQDAAMATGLAAVLEVLPVSSTFTGIADEDGPVGAAASDFDALENLRRLVFQHRVSRPKQLDLWDDATGGSR